VYTNDNPLRFYDFTGLYWVFPPSGGPGIEYPNPNDPPGPFGTVCGAEGQNSAYWVPDLIVSACRKHDKCYEDCAKICAGTWCKLSCDFKLNLYIPHYGLGTAILGGDAYEAAKRKEGCYGCEG
jgi:hypothetical protein